MEQLHSLPGIAIFDDEEANLKLYSAFFKDHFQVRTFQNPFRYEEALQEDTNAIIVDMQMPLMDGPRLLEAVQKSPRYNGCPVILISASSSESIIQTALVSGAIELLTRTMSPEEMILRIKNKILFYKTNSPIHRLGNVSINFNELRAVCKEETIDLTLTEMKIMKMLMKEYPRLCSREEINHTIWPGQVVMPTTLNTHLSNLRNKFHHWEYEILNVKGKGVKLVPYQK